MQHRITAAEVETSAGGPNGDILRPADQRVAMRKAVTTRQPSSYIHNGLQDSYQHGNVGLL